jgi:anti-sigma regulatory factor (Ser/Thr protein kinase)
VQVSSDDTGTGAVVFDERFDASTLHLLRERVTACAVGAGMPDERAAEVMIAVHELAANAVRHGAGAGRLLVRAAAGVLRCQVSDASPGTGTWPVQPGHGLWLVQQVADQVSVSSGPRGCLVAVVFRSPEPGHPDVAPA